MPLQGILLQTEYPFSNGKKGMIATPPPASRKEKYHDVNKMTQLYEVLSIRITLPHRRTAMLSVPMNP